MKDNIQAVLGGPDRIRRVCSSDEVLSALIRDLVRSGRIPMQYIDLSTGVAVMENVTVRVQDGKPFEVVLEWDAKDQPGVKK